MSITASSLARRAHQYKRHAKMGQLAQSVQASTGESVNLAYVDEGTTGPKAADAAKVHSTELTRSSS